MENEIMFRLHDGSFKTTSELTYLDIKEIESDIGTEKIKRHIMQNHEVVNGNSVKRTSTDLSFLDEPEVEKKQKRSRLFFVVMVALAVSLFMSGIAFWMYCVINDLEMVSTSIYGCAGCITLAVVCAGLATGEYQRLK